MSLCVFEEEVKQLHRHFIDQVLESKQGRYLNGGRRTKEFYVPVCQACHLRARNSAGGPAHASSGAAAAAAEDSDEDEDVMLRAIAASLEDFHESQAKAASLAERDAEAAEFAEAISLSQVVY